MYTLLLTAALVLFATMTTEPGCIFCQIVAKTQPAQIYYEDDRVMIFQDIKHSAPVHMLVVPKHHIKNAAHLTMEDFPLLDHMHQVGLETLQKMDGNADDCLMGFHWPPFNSVSHLHLHILAPASKMKFWARRIYQPSSMWFVTFDKCKELITTKSQL